MKVTNLLYIIIIYSMKHSLVLLISIQLYSCYHGYDKPQRKQMTLPDILIYFL